MGVVDDAGNRVSRVRRVSRGVTAGAMLTPGELGKTAVPVWRLLGVMAGRRGGCVMSRLVCVAAAGPSADRAIYK